MALQLQAFNLIHQKLDSEKLIKILRFGTNDYSGAFGDVNPIFNIETNNPTIPANTLIIPKNTNLLVGGQLITFDSESVNTYNDSNNTLLVLAIDLEDEKNYTNITTNKIHNTDTISNWGIGYLQGSSLDLNDETGNYKIIYGNKSIDDYHYQTIYWDDIILNPSSVSKGYIVPLMGKYNNEVVQLLGYKTGYELREFLTEKAIEKLASDLDKRYTHQDGTTQEYPNGGKVGNFNFEGSKISHNDSPFITVNKDKLNLDTYSNGALYVSGSSVSSGLLQVDMGGTGADTKFVARANLGIFRGTSSPEYYFDHHSWHKGNLQQGDIYFKIIT